MNTKTAAHTPGPWRASALGEIRGGDALTVAYTHGTDEAALRDARLIAAAPELLDAIKLLLDAFEVARANCADRVDFSEDERPRRARAAIAKATA